MSGAAPTDTISPPDEELIITTKELRAAHPDKSILKLLAQLKLDRPEWSVSEKRFRKAHSATSDGEGSTPGASQSAGTGGKGEKPLIADTGLDPSVDVASLAPKVEVKMFKGGKGKGLVAKDGLEMGEMLWQEEPWIVTSDPGHYPLLTQSMMCTQCFSIFDRPNPALSVPCSRCPTAHFCTRLCYSKAQLASHPQLLCPGENPAAEKLMKFVRQKGERGMEGVVKIVARWRTEREWSKGSEAEDMEKRVWKGMARISQKRKEAERREWEYVAENRMKEWREFHALLIGALNPPQGHYNHRNFQKLVKTRRNNPKPLTEKEEQKWFSFGSFLELLGLVGLNQEDSGGLYALHAHLNHSCTPNIQVRNLPKSYAPPSPSSLPCDLPPPLQKGDSFSNKLTILARQKIEQGEELTVSYVNVKMPRDERRKILREGYGFWCSCDRCEKEKEGGVTQE
ncbi:protein lysine methyltransferase SET5 [Cryptococcus wingfieldii CBS 7118]|uniref:Histone-lysine N-methyltransferase SET5 n=1 Tax=Cryptococcus wingfieldii CBS 7118 TaxID=1295528 RepID=A0A1E3JCN5_9TREE|nr:protein lysine methyltransferase SET5 [Cryptococcus wingfieldii CBS 7118]ODN98455.1 protein lysine methyltransferase SET5 [Cryptococcus wingfieldii CBS 7118]